MAAVRPARAADRVLRIVVPDWVPGLGNPYASTVNGAIHPFPGMFDTLTVMGDGGVAEPALATGWTNETQTRWRFTLREGVRFANGEACDAAAVAAMIAWLKTEPAQRYVLAAEAKGLAATVLDAHTIQIATAAPDAVLPKRLSLLPLVPPAYWTKVGPEGFAQAPIGSGPLLLQTWGRDRGRGIIVHNPQSWRPLAGLDRVEWIVLPDAGRRAQALITGEADMAYNIDFTGMDALAAANMQTIVRQNVPVAGLALPNIRAGTALSDVRVRQALNHAVNTAAIAQVILRGTVVPNGQGVVPGVFGYDPTIPPFAFDPDKARALLREAGHGKGLKLVAAVIAKSMVEGEAVFQQIAEDLRQVGVALELRSVSGADWVQMWVGGDWRGADMISMVWNGATFMDAIRAVEPFTCNRPGTFFCDPPIDAAIAATNRLFEPAERERALRAVLARLHDAAPSLYLFPQPELIGVAPRVKNIRYRGRFIDWSAITLGT